jgi:hypothetical protein
MRWQGLAFARMRHEMRNVVNKWNPVRTCSPCASLVSLMPRKVPTRVRWRWPRLYVKLDTTKGRIASSESPRTECLPLRRDKMEVPTAGRLEVPTAGSDIRRTIQGFVSCDLSYSPPAKNDLLENKHEAFVRCRKSARNQGECVAS